MNFRGTENALFGTNSLPCESFTRFPFKFFKIFQLRNYRETLQKIAETHYLIPISFSPPLLVGVGRPASILTASGKGIGRFLGHPLSSVQGSSPPPCSPNLLFQSGGSLNDLSMNATREAFSCPIGTNTLEVLKRFGLPNLRGSYTIDTGGL